MKELAYDREVLRRFCRERGIGKLELFGSARGKDFRADSDVDVLCTLTPERDRHVGLLEWVEIKLGLEEIFDRPVDLVSRRAIERSRNRYRRSSILSTASPLYVEG